MWHHELPTETVRRVLAVHGEAGAAWLGELPRRVDAVTRAWSLRSVGEPFAGARTGLVAPAVGRDGAALVLKLHASADWASREATALAHWDGRGSVRLVAASRELAALLLERVVPGDSLARLCAADDRAATAAAAAVIARLRTARGPVNSSLPDIGSWVAALRPARPAVPRAASDTWHRASSLADTLLADAAGTVLHGDLQHHNILRSRDGSWLAIDPKGLIGPSAAEPAALLRNPRSFVLAHPAPRRLLADRVAVLTEHLGDDRRQVVHWAYVLAVVAAAWAYEDGEAERDAERWLELAELVGSLPEAAH